MAKAQKIEEPSAEAVAVTESITYLPGQMDPPVIKWGGHTFHANTPKELTGHAEGTAREKLNLELIERARENKHFKVGSGSRSRRQEKALPTTPEEYRAYAVDWIKDPAIEHADQLIARFAKDRELQLACEVGADDFSYLATLFMPRLHDLAKGDELNEPQVSSLWIQNGINQLPW